MSSADVSFTAQKKKKEKKVPPVPQSYMPGSEKKKKERKAGVVMAAGLKQECTLAQRRETGRRNEVKLSRCAALSFYQRDSQITLGSKL